MNRRVLVVPTARLHEIVGSFEGYKPLDDTVIQMIERGSMWMDKAAAEADPSFKQLIPYHAIRCRNGNIFTYRRASENENYEEKRLQGMHSIGVGGHIDWKDGVDIVKAAGREVGEEITFEGEILTAKFLGGISMTDTPVNSVHFGLFFIIDISSNDVRPNDKEIAWGEPMPLNDMKLLFAEEGIQVEGWTKIVLPHLK